VLIPILRGLAYRGSGTGGILLIETTLVPGGKGRLVLTGSLGDVIKESAELGLTWVKAHAVQLGIVSHAHDDPLNDVDLHVSIGVSN
jgi:ATP-dependent Lon protease